MKNLPKENERTSKDEKLKELKDWKYTLESGVFWLCSSLQLWPAEPELSICFQSQYQ